MGLESKLPEGMVLTTTLEKMVNWSRQRSPWPLLFGLACCAIEMIHAGVSRHDISRFGAEVFRASPRQADIMILAGRISQKMAPVVKRLYEQMPEPKWVIAMGACASSGGVFDTYAVVQGVDRFIPVDIYVPGCPPRPEQLLQSVIDLQDKIKKTGTLTGREFARRTGSDGPITLPMVPADAVVAPGDYQKSSRLSLN